MRIIHLFIFLVSMGALAAQPKPAPPKPWLEMDYGPVMSLSLESSLVEKTMTQKGILIRLDEKTQSHVMFDADLMRYSVGWRGGVIDWVGVLYDGSHRTWASVSGEQVFATRLMPGWADAKRSFEDPRTRYKSVDYKPQPAHWQNRAYGPLPREHAQFKGQYRHGKRVVLSYTVLGTAVLDSPGVEQTGDGQVFTRTLNIAQSAKDLTMLVLEQAEGSAVKVALKCDAKGVALKTEGKEVRLVIPASATPAKIKLLIGKEASENSPAAEDLAALTRGGPAQYPELLTTQGTLGKVNENGFAVDAIASPASNPWKARLRFSGFDFFPDGKSAAVCTWDGDVYLVRNLNEKLDRLTWQRIATGLYQPLGLKIISAPSPVIHVSCRDQIARLHDLNGDSEVDFYECFNSDHQVTEHFHEFAMGLETDAEGNFYYAKSGRHALEGVVPQHGTVMRVSRDGSKSEILASGLRAANGIGVGPRGEIAVTDQEGFWMPANRINVFTPSPGNVPFFGNIWGYFNPKRDPKDGYDPPLVWLPVNLDRSPAEVMWVPAGHWGALAGQMLHTSYGTGKLYLSLPQTVEGVMQGAILPLPVPNFRTGIMRARFSPSDRQLYLAGMVGWATNCAEPGGFYRIRYSDSAQLNLPLAWGVKKDAIEITFSHALDRATATDVGSYSLQEWNYRWTQNYGSKHYRPSDPKKEGPDELEVDSAALSADGKTITLKVADLHPVMQQKLQLDLKSASGVPIKLTLHSTINKVPQ